MEFDQFDFDKKTTDELFKELVLKALEGKQSNFEFIRSYGMLRIARMYKHGVSKVAKMFKNLEKELIKSYTSLIASGEDDLEIIMSIKQFNACAEYYKKERALVKDMISEFRTYVMSGHILQTLLGGVRPDHECVDYRKLPIKFW